MNEQTRQALHSSKKLDYETPQALFDKLDREFAVDLDAAASKDNAKCEKYFTKENDALKYPWCALGAIWLNPPYGRNIGLWIEKAYQESQRQPYPVVCLIPARTDTRCWWRWCMKADEIRFIKGRVTFVGCEHPAPFPSAIIVFRQTAHRTPKVSMYKYRKGRNNEYAKK